MNKYAHFGHVLHFSGLAYGRHRVQGVKIGRLQPELAFQQIVSQTLHFVEDFPLLFSSFFNKFCSHELGIASAELLVPGPFTLWVTVFSGKLSSLPPFQSVLQFSDPSPVSVGVASAS